MKSDLIAVLDIGKTHARLSLIDAQSGAQVWIACRVNERKETSIGWQLDIEGIECWLIEAFASAPDRDRICTVVPIAHGAAAVLIGDRGQILAAPDYEDPRFESVSEEYERERDTFTSTYSPSLPLGLNLGRQLFYLERRESKLFAQVAKILTFAQFWAWRLSGVMASEVTSLGCHSDLWRPQSRSFSSLASRHGWNTLFPPARFAGDTLGPARGSIAEIAGLPPSCRVVCGAHDSNASYLRHLVNRRRDRFAVISSGTWTVLMANGAELDRLRAERDTLANVDVFGSPVATARFMGGREYEAIARTSEPPTFPALEKVIAKHAMALPTFAVGGPFSKCKGRLLQADGLDDAERAALATLYVALMSDVVVEALDADGDIVLDGPLASNPLYGALLASLRPRSRVWGDDGQCAATAICYLAGFAQACQPSLRSIQPLNLDVLENYRRDWREWAIAGHGR